MQKNAFWFDFKFYTKFFDDPKAKIILEKIAWFIECGRPNSIANGFISIDADSYLVGTTLTYSCDVGFGTRDDVVTECQDTSFTWTLDDNLPTCIRSKIYN